MNNTQLILIIDLGTSGPKVSIFTEKLKLIGYEFVDVPLILVGKDGVEQNPSDWVNGINQCYEKLLARNIFDPKSIIAINVTSQWGGTVALDENGNHLMNSLIWMDARGAADASSLLDGLIKFDGYEVTKAMKWINITGGIPAKSGKDPLAHILYIKNKLPEIYKKTKKFLEPKDYLNYILTNQMVASFDSITAHWLTDNRKINKITYHDGLIKKSGIDKNKLPDLVATNSIIGPVKKEVAKRWGLNDNVRVIAGNGDIHAAAVGSGAIKDYEAHFYIGTSAWMVCHVPFKRTDLLHNMTTIPSGIPGRYMLVNEQQTAGACLNFLRDQLFFPDDLLRDSQPPKDFYKKLDELANVVKPGSEGVMFLPWLNGERTPVDDHHARGAFYNLSLGHERKHLVRAVLEGVALNARWLLLYSEKLVGKKFTAINFIGGGARSKVWSQILADVLNRPIKQMKDPITANAKGAAILALVALDKMKLEDAELSVEVDEVFNPHESTRKLYDERFKLYLKIYQSNKNIFKRLNEGTHE